MKEPLLTMKDALFSLFPSCKQHAEPTVKMAAMSHQDCSEYLEIANEYQERAFISQTFMEQSMSDEDHN